MLALMKLAWREGVRMKKWISPPKLTTSSENHCVISPSHHFSRRFPCTLYKVAMLAKICSIACGPFLSSRGIFISKSIQLIFLYKHCRQASHNIAKSQPAKRAVQSHQTARSPSPTAEKVSPKKSILG